MNLFEHLPTIENTKVSFTGDRSKQMEHEYVCWHIGNSSLLKNTWKNTGSYFIITANISLLDAHWFFLVGVDFYDERSKNNNSVKESIRFYLFDSMHHQKDVIMKHKLDKSSMFDNFYISLTRLWKLLFFKQKKWQ